MEKRKNSGFGKYMLPTGIMAGFVFLGALFAVFDGNSGTLDVLLLVGLSTTSVSVMLLSFNEQRKKVCKTSDFKK